MSLFCRRALLFTLSFLLVALYLNAGRTSRAESGSESWPGGSPTMDAAFNEGEFDAFEVLADSPKKPLSSGFDFSNLDRGAQACQDFNRFANGGWIDRNPVPAAYSRWGRFETLEEQNLNVLHDILDGLMKKKVPAKGNEQRIADFYGSCMDEQKIEAAG